MCIALAIGATAAVSAGVGGYEASTAAGEAGHAESQSAGIFGEQQGYAQQLAALIANPSSVTSLPNYQFQFGQGQQAVQRGEAASGFGGSGNEATALTQFGQGFAQSAYGQQESLLASLSGLTAPSSVSSLTQAATGAQAQSSSTLSGLVNSLGYLSVLGSGAGGGLGLGGGWGGGTVVPPSVNTGGGGAYDGSGVLS